MDKVNRSLALAPIFLLISAPAFAQSGVLVGVENAPVSTNVPNAVEGGAREVSTASTDFAGEWEYIGGEEEEREPGDFLGIPVNAAGQMRAETHDASEWSLPEFQCRPHPIVAQWRANGELRVVKEASPLNRLPIAYHLGFVRSSPRTIYLDGRAHPTEDAPHTWFGFSTGRWDGNTLVVTTTHLKEAYYNRNGQMYSDRATVIEWFMRHGEYLTVIVRLEDPVYLSEPFVQSVTYQWRPHVELPYFPCTIAAEQIGAWRVGSAVKIPHFLPGKNPFDREFAEKNGVPYEATRGGAETMYPDYRKKLPDHK